MQQANSRKQGGFPAIDIAKRMARSLSECRPEDIHFRADIRNLDDAKAADGLPLLYTWSDERYPGSLVISINGGIVQAKMLETMPKSDPKFARVWELTVQQLNKRAAETIAKCGQRGLLRPR